MNINQNNLKLMQSKYSSIPRVLIYLEYFISICHL